MLLFAVPMLVAAGFLWQQLAVRESGGGLQFIASVLGQPDRVLDSKDWRGSVVVLNAWASWCIPCRTELPMLARLKAETGVLLAGLNYLDDAPDALRWLEFYGDPFDVSLVDRDGQLEEELGIRGVPQTWVIDTRGVVRWVHTGALTEQDLEQEILPLLHQLTD